MRQNSLKELLLHLDKEINALFSKVQSTDDRATDDTIRCEITKNRMACSRCYDLQIQITFFVLGKALFKVYENGRFILEEGDYNFFRKEIVYPTLESALEEYRRNHRI